MISCWYLCLLVLSIVACDAEAFATPVGWLPGGAIPSVRGGTNRHCQRAPESKSMLIAPKPYGAVSTNLKHSSIRWEYQSRPSALEQVKQAHLYAFVRYSRLCESRPIITKSITAATIMAFSDIMAQSLQASAAGNVFLLNRARLGAFVLTDLIFKGPWLHFWFGSLSTLGRWMERQFGSSKGTQAGAQLVLDQTMGAVAFYCLYFFAFEISESLVMMRSPAFATTKAKLFSKLVSLMLANYSVWPIVCYINFRYVPESLRVLVTSVVAVFWNAFLCTRVA